MSIFFLRGNARPLKRVTMQDIKTNQVGVSPVNEEEETQVTFRVPVSLRNAIAERAKAENRTLSGQIRHIIDRATAETE